jgi:hypothetical protein
VIGITPVENDEGYGAGHYCSTRVSRLFRSLSAQRAARVCASDSDVISLSNDLRSRWRHDGERG